MSDEIDWIVDAVEHKYTCPECATELASSETYPSCNECECCFCSEECRAASHSRTAHQYDKPIYDYS